MNLELMSFNIEDTIVDLVRILTAFLLAIPIGWERHKSSRNIGLRTFPIVAIGACSFILLGKHLPGSTAESEARIIQGLVSGIGFIGGGAILKHGTDVRGLATAASIWCTGAIGAAVAFQRVELAVVLSIITFSIMRLLSPVAEDSLNTDEKENETVRNSNKTKN